MLNWFRKTKTTEEASQTTTPEFHFSSGLVIKNGEVSTIRGTAYDPDTEKPIGAWGQLTIDGKEYYTSINLDGYSKKTIDQAPMAALAKAMEQANIKAAADLAAYIKRSIRPSR